MDSASWAEGNPIVTGFFRGRIEDNCLLLICLLPARGEGTPFSAGFFRRLIEGNSPLPTAHCQLRTEGNPFGPGFFHRLIEGNSPLSAAICPLPARLATAFCTVQFYDTVWISLLSQTTFMGRCRGYY